jgi:hypothetical protein
MTDEISISMNLAGMDQTFVRKTFVNDPVNGTVKLFVNLELLDQTELLYDYYVLSAHVNKISGHNILTFCIYEHLQTGKRFVSLCLLRTKDVKPRYDAVMMNPACPGTKYEVTRWVGLSGLRNKYKIVLDAAIDKEYCTNQLVYFLKDLRWDKSIPNKDEMGRPDGKPFEPFVSGSVNLKVLGKRVRKIVDYGPADEVVPEVAKKGGGKKAKTTRGAPTKAVTYIGSSAADDAEDGHDDEDGSSMGTQPNSEVEQLIQQLKDQQKQSLDKERYWKDERLQYIQQLKVADVSANVASAAAVTTVASVPAVTPQYALTQYAPTQYAPTQYTPTQNAPTQYAPTQNAPTQYAPTQYTPTQNAPTQYTPTQNAPTQYTPTQNAPTQYAPTQYTPTQNAPTQYAPTQYEPTQYALTQYATPQNATSDLFAQMTAMQSQSDRLGRMHDIEKKNSILEQMLMMKMFK